MKNILFYISLIVCAFAANAQDCFKYFKGEKDLLIIDSTKITAYLWASENVDFESLYGYTKLESHILDGDTIKVELYDISGVSTLPEALKNNPLPKSVSPMPCFLFNHRRPMYPNGYLTIKLKNLNDYPLLDSIAQQWHLEILCHVDEFPGWYSLRMLPGEGRNSVDTANRIFETNLFQFSSPSFNMDVREISYNPEVHEQWGLCNNLFTNISISASEAWNYATGRGVVIAIIDNGIDMEHPDLKDNLYHLSYNDSSGGGCDEHATHIVPVLQPQ